MKLTRNLHKGTYILQDNTGYPKAIIRLYPSVNKLTINGKRYTSSNDLNICADEVIQSIARMNNCTYFKVD